MPTVQELDTQVFEKVDEATPTGGSRALDLIDAFHSYSEWEVQRVIAQLLVSGRIRLTQGRRLVRS
jgi:hypothetical protein